MSMAATDSLIGQQIGDYRIVDLVGRGGMGGVYRAQDESQGLEVALKVLPLDHLDDLRDAERFQREAEVAARFDHPNIVSIFTSGRESGHLYMAMELIAGRSLRQLLRQEGRLSVDRALGVVGQVLAALQVAHDEGVIHRDIKAENVLLQEDGIAKVLDFGVAKLDSGTVLTRVNEILGTVEYMAPEQILGDRIGPATDLYAAGVLLYEMLTGTLPFVGDSPATLVYHQLNEDPQAPSFLNPDVPRSLDRLVLRLLDKVAENRYGSAAAALEVLEEIRQRHRMFDIPELASEATEVDEAEEMRTRDFRPRFIGRQQEVEDLSARFDGLADGGRLVFLTGEAGIGKSRALEELDRHVQGRGGRTIQGTCFFEHGMGPYMPFLDGLGNLFGKTENGLSDEERSELGQLLEREGTELAELVTSGSTTAKVRAGFAVAFGIEEEAEAGRQRFFDTIFELLTIVSGKRPLVLILEDMHWADEGTLQLLQYLVRRIGETQLLCVATYRPEELVEEEPGIHPLGGVLRQLGSEGLLEEVRLGRLDREGVAQLARSLFLEAEFSEDFGDFLFAQSQGNPFIAVEVLKLLRSQDILYCESGVWSVKESLSEVAIPERVNALVMQRVDQLDTDHRELLQLAAVIGPEFTSRVLEKAAGMSRISLLKALFRLEKTHRLIVAEDGAYDFSHSKIREVLYDEIPWELRCEYHRVVAAVLEEQREEGREVEDAVLGRHLYRAEDYERAVPHLSRAGDEALQLFSWRQAAILFDQVEESCRKSGGTAEVLLHALKHGGMASSHLGASEQALEKFGRMQQTAREEKRPEEEADAWIRLGREKRRMRRLDESVAACQEALACLGERTDDLFRGRALNSWGFVDFECGRYDEAERRWLEARPLLEDRAPEEAGNLLNNLAVLATVRGDLDRAWEFYEEALALDAKGEPSPQTAHTYHNMGMLRADQERWDEALAIFARTLELCRQTRSSTLEPSIHLNRAEVLIGMGNLVEGRQDCSRALRGFRRQDDGLGAADALRMYGRICRLERSWEEGKTCLEKSIELNRRFGASISLGEALYERALLDRDEGQGAAALEPLKEAEEIFSRAQASLDLERVHALMEELEVKAEG